MTEPFALRLQLLGSLSEKVLVAAAVISAQSESDVFSARDVKDFFDRLAVPVNSNSLGPTLKRLGDRQLLLRKGDGGWTVTPLGRSEIDDLMSALDPSALESGWLGAEFAHVEQTIIPWYMAPPRWQVGLRRLMDTHPFETNVFCMTRFPSEGAPDSAAHADPVGRAVEVIRSTLGRYGLTTHLASERLIEDDLLGNVGAYMWGCKYGIGILEDRVGRGVNYNAVIELGGMMLTGRRCALLKDEGTPHLPTDLSGQVYKSVQLDDLDSVESATDLWARQDLGLTVAK